MLSSAYILILKTVVDLPPYAGKEDIEVARLLSLDSAKTGTKLIPVNVLIGRLIEVGVYAALDANRDTDSVSRMILGLLNNPQVQTIDLSEPGPSAMLGGLEAKGNLTATQKAAIMSLGTCFLTEAEALLGQGKTVHHLDVAKARRG